MKLLTTNEDLELSPRARASRDSSGARVCALIERTSAVLLCLAAGGMLAFTLFVVYGLHVPLPYWDEWSTVFDFQHAAEGRYSLAELASQHNEHRLLVPRIFFFADERFFALSGLFDATATVLLQLANAAILIALAVRRVARPAHRALLAAFVLVLAFTLRQEENFTNGFQLQFVGVFTAALSAGAAYAAALDRSARGRRSAALFALAALGCAVAAYTMANGVLLGFALSGVAVLRRAPARVVVASLALSALLAALFFHGYQPGGDSRPLPEAVAHPLPYLRYVATYLGALVDEDHLRPAQALGALGMALAAAAAWRVRRGGGADRSGTALVAFMAFVLASAAATAYGRIALGTAQALSSRYATPSLLFWCAAAVFWFPVVVGPGRPRPPALALGLLMAGLAILAVVDEAGAWPALARRSAALRRVSDSLMAGLYDANAAEAYEITSPEQVAEVVPFLRQRRLAAFADPEYPGLGRPVGAAAPPGACGGAATATAEPALGPGGVRLSGWAADRAAGRATRRILVTDASGIVVGFGSASLPGEPSRLWTGYARAGAGDLLRVYARLRDDAPCLIAEAAVARAE